MKIKKNNRMKMTRGTLNIPIDHNNDFEWKPSNLTLSKARQFWKKKTSQ